MIKMNKNIKYEIEIPIQGKTHLFKTDLICNSCGKQIQDGEYLYFCANDKDDLCSAYECLKKHAGHQFFRWGKIQLKSDTQKQIPMITSTLTTMVPKISVPSAAVPAAPAAGAPPKAPLVNTATLSLRTALLSELKRLKCLMEPEE